MEPPFLHAGELAALTTAACWTVSALAFEAAGRRVGSMPVNVIRLLMAFGLLAVIGTVRRGLPLPSDATAHAWAWLSVSGLLGFTLGDLCLFRAFVLIGARRSMLVMTLVPVLTAFIAWGLNGEVLAANDWVGMAVTMAGVVWVLREREFAASGPAAPPWGILLAVGGAVGQAAGLVLSKVGMRAYDAFAATQIRVIAGLSGFALLFTVLGLWPRVRAALADGAAVRYTGLGAVFGPFLGVTLSLVAVKYSAAGVAATILALPPVLILVPTALRGRERVSARAVAGALLAVAGAGLVFL